MDMKEQAVRRWHVVRPHALRALCCAFICSFLLPYVDVMGCSTKKMSTYRGYELVTADKALSAPAALYVATIVIFAVMLALLFYKKEASAALKSFAASWRAIAAALCGLIIWVIPGLQFLFDGVFAREGQLLGLACAALLFIDGITVSVRGYLGLIGGRGGAAPYSKPLFRYHVAVIVVSLCLIPLLVGGMHDDIPLAVLVVLTLSLPFAFSQCIVLEGVRRGERWTRAWAAAVVIVMAGAAAVAVMGVL